MRSKPKVFRPCNMHDPLVERLVFLTGAGFSMPMGYPSAAQMKTVLFNDIEDDDDKTLKSALLECDTYEEAVDRLVHFPELTNAISAGLGYRFSVFDGLMRALYPGAERPYIRLFRMLSDRCASSPDGSLIFATLNQDLLVERLWARRDEETTIGLTISGIGEWTKESFGYQQAPEHPLAPRSEITPDSLVWPVDPNSEDIPLVPGINYLKLHGSANWEDDSKHPMFFTGTKEKESGFTYPFFQAMLENFRKAICCGSAKIICIGFSFGDPPITSLIRSAMRDHSAQLTIVDPKAVEIAQKHFAYLADLRQLRLVPMEFQSLFERGLDKPAARRFSPWFDAFYRHFESD